MKFSVVSYFDVFEDWECHKEWHPNTKKKLRKNIVGALYRFKNDFKNIDSSIEFRPIGDIYYRMKGMVKKWNGNDVNALIMKQVRGPRNRKIFSISKEQCDAFHIKFEHGLEIFSMAGNHFQRIIEKYPNVNKAFDSNDLSTYNHSKFDGTIRHILIKIEDIERQPKKVRDKSSKKVYRIVKDKDEQFLGNEMLGGLTFRAKKLLKTPNDKVVWGTKELIPYRIIPADIIKPDESSLYIELILNQPSEGIFTEDGYIGIDKQVFKNLKFEDVFEIKEK